MPNLNENVNIEKLYSKECTLLKEEFISSYNINENGLSSSGVQELLHKYGLNEISGAKPKKWYNYFLESLFSPFNCILLRYCCCTFLYRHIFNYSTKLRKYYSYCYFGFC